MKRIRPTKIIRNFAIILTLSVMTLTQSPMTVFADLSQNDIQAVLNNWPAWVDGDKLAPDACTNAAPGTIISTTGKGEMARIEYAFKYLMSKRFTPQQAAGIVGNLRQESGGVNPASNNTAARANGHTNSKGEITGNDGKVIIPGVTERGGGIAQWEGGRWYGPSGLLNFVAGEGDFETPQGDGTNWKVLSIQLDFLWGELTHKFENNKQPGLREVKAATTVEAATRAFEEEFERAGTPNMPRRIKLANEVYDMATKKGWINDNVLTEPEENTSTTGNCSSTPDPAVNINTDGYAFPMAPQKKKDYGTLPCEKPGRNGPYTKNGIYTDRYGNKAKNTGCHHDATPAFDLMDGNGGSKVYAITNGRIVRTTKCYTLAGGSCVPGCSTIQFRANNGTDKKYYWYGHLQNVTVDAGQSVTAGKVIAQVAASRYGSKCWGGGPHLHIDRGCSDGNTPKTGGNKDCRDPAFVPLLKKIWDGLPS